MKLDKVYLQHILDEIEFIKRTSADLNYDTFVESETYTRAFSRSIEIIGEASKTYLLNLEIKTMTSTGRK